MVVKKIRKVAKGLQKAVRSRARKARRQRLSVQEKRLIRDRTKELQPMIGSVSLFNKIRGDPALARDIVRYPEIAGRLATISRIAGKRSSSAQIRSSILTAAKQTVKKAKK